MGCTKISVLFSLIIATTTSLGPDKVIMVSGGEGEGRRLNSAEIYLAGTGILKGGGCRIPNMPSRRSGTVTKEFLVCGGRGAHVRDCVIFNPESGRWEEAHKLNQDREGSSAFDSSRGLVIMGGGGASTTTEILRNDLTSDPYFDITERRSYACSITDYDTDTVLITGGFGTLDKVERYGAFGQMETLPRLNRGRYGHGCGSYIKDGKKKYLVVGGRDKLSRYLSSTEIWSPGDSSWTTLEYSPLHVRRTAFYAGTVSLNNNIYLFGNFEGGVTSHADTVYEFNGDKEEWTIHGTIHERRSHVGVSLVPLSSGVLDYCTK